MRAISFECVAGRSVCEDGVERLSTSKETRWDEIGAGAKWGGGILGGLTEVEVDKPEYRNRSTRMRHFDYRLQLDDSLVIKFVNARQPKERIAFLSAYGFPGDQPRILEAELDGWQKSLKGLVVSAAAAGSLPNALIAVNGAFAEFDRRSRSYSGRTTPKPLTLAPLITGSQSGGPLLQLRAEELEHAMAFEIAMMVMQDVRAHRCQHCDGLYLSGTASGRRAVGKYCSDKCRMAAIRAKQSKDGTVVAL